jgi:hypothetical protein
MGIPIYKQVLTKIIRKEIILMQKKGISLKVVPSSLRQSLNSSFKWLILSRSYFDYFYDTQFLNIWLVKNLFDKTKIKTPFISYGFCNNN